MLTVLVITFIVAKYLNNSGGVFLIPDIKKRIKTTIQDPERAAAMLGAVSSAQLAGKRLEKIRIETNMRLKGINTMALAIIDAPERRAKVASAVEDYRVKMDNLLGGLTEWNFRDNSVLKNFNASEAQLWEIFEKLNSLREACFAAFIELYFQLASLSSDDEWNTATKARDRLTYDSVCSRSPILSASIPTNKIPPRWTPAISR